MEFRKATLADLPVIMEIYAAAKQFMAATGNPNQWLPGYPGAALMRGEIERGVCWLCCAGAEVLGVFCCIPGADPTYAKIYEGAWLNADPYVTIHRIAAAKPGSGVARACFAWCAAQGWTVRIDTHADNKVMQKVLAQNGFAYCGIIHLADDRPRLAYCRAGEGKGCPDHKL